jgi:hypothetical protein
MALVGPGFVPTLGSKWSYVEAKDKLVVQPISVRRINVIVNHRTSY